MKEKISITLDRELLKKSDALIDGIIIRNRSQAIEHLIRNGLIEKNVECAIILAGGALKGLKYKNTYKPLALIEGKPLIVNTIEQLKEAGVTKIVIAAGPIADKIRALIGDGSKFGVEVVYIQDSGIGTAGAVKVAEKHITGPFFVVFGDVYFDFDLGKIIDSHRINNSEATMLVSVTGIGESKDFIRIVGNKITEFQYQKGNVRTHHVNAGVYLLNHDILKTVPKTGSLEREILTKLARHGKLNAFVFSGNWKHLE